MSDAEAAKSLDADREDGVYLLGIETGFDGYRVNSGVDHAYVDSVKVNGMHVSFNDAAETECHDFEIVERENGTETTLLLWYYPPEEESVAVVKEIPFEEAHRILLAEGEMLRDAAEEQLRINYEKRGDGWQYADPRFHMWKGIDEWFSATDALKDGDLDRFEKRIGDGWNHIRMASYVAYSEEDQ